MEDDARGFDGAAAVTRSLLGYGVIAGAIYLAVGLTLALTREGFDLAVHPLSLLMLGDGGWMQRANLILAGAMTVAAGIGIARALSGAERGTRVGPLVVVYGVCLIASGVFPPDAMAGFPPGAADDQATLAGILHLAFGAVGFLTLAVAAVLLGGWFALREQTSWARSSRAAGAVVVLAFLVGAALATSTVGVASLWLAVVVSWAWLATISVYLYRFVPHPDAERRAQQRH